MSYKNKFNINYWLRKFYTSTIYQKLVTNNDKIKKQVFTSIYKSNHWVQDDHILAKNSISVSGHGSNINTNQFFKYKKTGAPYFAMKITQICTLRARPDDLG